MIFLLFLAGFILEAEVVSLVYLFVVPHPLLDGLNFLFRNVAVVDLQKVLKGHLSLFVEIEVLEHRLNLLLNEVLLLKTVEKLLRLYSRLQTS